MLIKEIVHISPFSWLTKVFFLLLKQFNLYLTTLNPKRLPQLYTARHSALHKFIAVFSAAPAASTHYKYLRAGPLGRIPWRMRTSWLVCVLMTTHPRAKWPESIPAGHSPSALLPIISPPGGERGTQCSRRHINDVFMAATWAWENSSVGLAYPHNLRAWCIHLVIKK